MELRFHRGAAEEEEEPDAHGEKKDQNGNDKELAGVFEIGHDVFGEDKGFERTCSDDAEAQCQRDGTPNERSDPGPRFQVEKADTDANADGGNQRWNASEKKESNGQILVDVPTALIRGQVHKRDEIEKPDEQDGHALKDDERGGRGDACGAEGLRLLHENHDAGERAERE